MFYYLYHTGRSASQQDKDYISWNTYVHHHITTTIQSSVKHILERIYHLAQLNLSRYDYNFFIKDIVSFQGEQQHKLQVFEIEMLRKIFGPKMEELRRKLGYYIKRYLMICTGHILLLGQRNLGGYDRLHVSTGWGLGMHTGF
jgi:hypothetical protein